MNTLRSRRAYNISDFLAKGVADEHATASDRSAGEGASEAIESRSVATDSSDESEHGS
jgi:hypothetical protein